MSDAQASAEHHQRSTPLEDDPGYRRRILESGGPDGGLGDGGGDHGAARPSEGAGVTVARRRRVPGDRWPWVVFAVPLLGIVLPPLRLGALALRHQTASATPDLHETLAATMAAGRFGQFVGPWSRLGLYHPGPFWFYWAAPFVSVAGDQPAGLVLAALVLVATCGAVICAAAWHSAGRLAGAVAGVVVLVAMHQLSLHGLAYPWNPTILIMPVAAGLVATAAVFRHGSLVWVAIASWMGSFAMQAHLGAIVLGGLIVAASIVGGVATRRRAGTSTSRWAWSVLAVVIAVPWSPVLIDQVVGTGQLGVMARYTLTGEVDEQFPTPPPSKTLDLGPGEVVPHMAAMMALAEPEIARWGGADVVPGLTHEPHPASTVALVAVVAAALAGAQLRRRWPEGPDGFRVWLCRLALAAAGLQAIVTFRARHEFRYYLIAGSSGVGIVLWLGAALAVATLAAKAAASLGLRRSTFRAVGAAAVLFASGAAVALTPTQIGGVPMRTDHRHGVILGLLAATPTGTFTTDIDTPEELATMHRMVESLEYHGRRIKVHGFYVPRFSDRQRELPDGDHEIRLLGGNEPPPDGCQVIGAYDSWLVCVSG